MKVVLSALTLAVVVAALPQAKAFAASDSASITQQDDKVYDRRGRGHDDGANHRRR